MNNGNGDYGLSWRVPVSIPFKRESTCERENKKSESEDRCVSIPFKRESTCEHALKAEREQERERRVSIPFKRESTCEPKVKKEKRKNESIVSIPFKRESTCELAILIGIVAVIVFQFPSNGKARVNLKEAISKINYDCFNSLQTGKHV